MDNSDNYSHVSFSSGEADEILRFLDRAKEPAPERVVTDSVIEERQLGSPDSQEPPQQVAASQPAALCPGAVFRRKPRTSARPYWQHRLKNQLGLRLPRGPFALAPDLAKRVPPELLQKLPSLPLSWGPRKESSEDEPHRSNRDPDILHNPEVLAERQSEDEPHHLTASSPFLSQGPRKEQSEDEPHRSNRDPDTLPYPGVLVERESEDEPHHLIPSPPSFSQGSRKEQSEDEPHRSNRDPSILPHPELLAKNLSEGEPHRFNASLQSSKPSLSTPAREPPREAEVRSAGPSVTPGAGATAQNPKPSRRPDEREGKIRSAGC